MSLPTPYYEQDGITIYCGDNRRIVPLLDEFDLLLTDPPYGIGKDGQKQSTGDHGGRKGYEFQGWDQKRPERWVFDLLMTKTRDQIIWGGNYFADCLRPTMKWLVWDKGQRINQSDGELAWTSLDGALRILTMNRVELMADGAVHPTQKPEKLISWCFTHFPDAESVLDPWMGSGTALVAAKLRGLRAVGIEINEDYCKAAVQRLRQGVLIPC